MLKKIKLYEDFLNKNQKTYESINIDRKRYEYPYNKLVIIINSMSEYLKTIVYFEKLFNIKINNVTEYFGPGILFVSVVVLYDIISLNCNEIRFSYLFDYYTKRSDDIRSGDINIEVLLKNLKDNNQFFYFNIDDVIYNISDLNNIKYLLLSGSKSSFNYLYLNKNQKTYESLLNKLKGPSEEEILNNIKNKPGKILEQAVINDDIELIKKVFENASFISYNDKNNAMWYACQYNKYDIVKLLNNYGIKINMEVAANKGYIDILKLALDKGQTFLETDILKSGINGGQIESVKFIFENYDIDKIDNLIIIEHIIKLTNEVPKNRYVDDRSPLIPNRIEIFKYIINKFDYSLDKLEDLWKYAQDKGSYTIRNYIIDIIKERKGND